MAGKSACSTFFAASDNFGGRNGSPRATAELLAEVDHRIGGMVCIIGLLTEYEQRLSPRLLRLAGGDRFPRRSLSVVPPT